MYDSLLPVCNMSFPAIPLSSNGFHDGKLDGEHKRFSKKALVVTLRVCKSA
ncbi:hypothetical protein DPMN_017939 [Dreissena polymorpha]|uniref:Uncharacterized protein n=1 Tax=Dreissena polymorpha TaxID=45954 RepID=A0A9D4S7Y1_DREPO|nr:hypothetical protein DPMN_017939 [Dreissena polymorpha]